MQTLKRFLDFYINSSIHVALAVTCLMWLTYKNFDLTLDENLLFFTFFSTISSYNFVKYFGLAKFHHRSLSRWLKHIQIFSFLCFIPLLYFAFQLQQTTLLYLGGLGVVTFFYAIPLLPKKFFIQAGKLRAISGFKIYIIAFVWAVTTVIVPFINQDVTISNDVILTAIQRFLYVLIAMLPFEIRDLQYDSIKLSTIPQRIGIKLTKMIGLILCTAFFGLEFFKKFLYNDQITVLFIVTVLLGVFLIFSRVKQSKYYSAFWVEAIPIVWLVLTLSSLFVVS